jgi:multidrug resistance efflux pump
LNGDAQRVAVTRAEAGVAAAESSEAKYQEQLPQQIASAQADLQAAQAQIVSASAQRDTHAAIAAAEAAWRQARLDQQQAEDAHQKVIDAELFGPREEQARLVVENAERATQAAWLRLEQLKSGSASDRANSAELAAARSRLGAAQAKLDRLKAEANGQPNQTYVAAIQQAEAALQSARVRLADTELRAPFDGTLAQLNLKVGETATPGSPVVVLADFSGWQVVTEDLTEIEVPGVQESQPVQITIDALPELKLKGEVKSIGSVYQTQSGDIVYPVKISLLDTDARLRWGMTAGVAFEK